MTGDVQRADQRRGASSPSRAGGGRRRRLGRARRLPARGMQRLLRRDEGDGVAVFDAGIAADDDGLAAVRRAARRDHAASCSATAHADHRGAAAGLRRPRLLPPGRARGRRGRRRHALLPHRPSSSRAARRLLRRSCCSSWDGGPVKIAGTVAEGDDVAGFEVVHLPGHAPGQIALWRESDRLALTTDCFYTLDPQTGRARPRGRRTRLQLRHRAGARARSASSPRWSPRRAGPATRPADRRRARPAGARARDSRYGQAPRPARRAARS